jgi:hypothetical protein
MEARNATVTFLNTLQPPSDPELDNILSLICKIMESPAAFIALFDDKHIFCRNTSGMQRGDFPWRWSMCAWTMQKDHPQTLVVEDVDKDARFADNLGARGLGVKFYVGSPLVASNGHRLGSICFVDNKPRKMDAYHCQILNNFSELVVRELEKDIALQIKTKEHSQLEQVRPLRDPAPLHVPAGRHCCCCAVLCCAVLCCAVLFVLPCCGHTASHPRSAWHICMESI